MPIYIGTGSKRFLDIGSKDIANMDSSSENLEFFAEFAQDCKEIIEELTHQQNQLAETIGRESGNSQSLLNGVYQNFQAIRNSAEFLGLDPFFQVADAVGAYFDVLKKEQRELTLKDIDVLARALECLDAFVIQLAGKARLERTEPLIRRVRAAMEDNSGMREPEPEPAPEVTTPLPSDDFDDYSDDGDFPDFQITITPEMVATYIQEAEEQLEVTEASLLALEKNLKDEEALDSAFRGMHTFKGNSGLFNYSHLEKLGHEFEEILEGFKSGARQIEHQGVSLMLRVLDVLKATTDKLPEGDGSVENCDTYLDLLKKYRASGQVSKASTVSLKGDATLLGEILIEMGELERDQLERGLNRQAEPIGEILCDMGSIGQTNLDQALLIQQQRRANKTETAVQRRSATQNIRVDLFKLDSLMNLVGELIIAENTVVNNPDLEDYELPHFRKAALQLNRISRDLQDIAMSLRMVPIEATFHKMVRVVRDVSQKQNKQVQLVMEGEDTEVDKSVIEHMANPMLHLIRNAIDHGIEVPEERERLGKSRTGTVNLRAYHEGGQVVIEVRDDGKGIDSTAVIAKAREKGLITQHHEFISEQEVNNLIFEPGFSTASIVTDISGRGVGMDVVKRSIDVIKGRINIHSELGVGTTFSIRIPLTLAIIEGMLIRVGVQLFTVPLLSIRESLRTDMSAVSRTIDGSEMVSIRKELVPVIRLHELFKTQADFTELNEGILIVVEHGAYQFCLLADEIIGQYQTVIKGLSEFFGMATGISGTSILSNGDISLILDIQGIVDNFLKFDWQPAEVDPKPVP